MGSRRLFLSWVLRVCEIDPVKRTYIEGLRDSEPRLAGLVREYAPTMIYQSPVDSLRDLGIAGQDGYAREVLDEDKTYVSVVGFGWIPLLGV